MNWIYWCFCGIIVWIFWVLFIPSWSFQAGQLNLPLYSLHFWISKCYGRVIHWNVIFRRSHSLFFQKQKMELFLLCNNFSLILLLLILLFFFCCKSFSMLDYNGMHFIMKQKLKEDMLIIINLEMSSLPRMMVARYMGLNQCSIVR